MELTTLKPLDEATVQITHPITKEPLDITFTVYGSDSKQYRQAQRDTLVARMESKTNTADNIESDELEILVRCTKDFTNIELDGEALEFSEENTRKVLKEYTWLKDQISMFIMNRTNFFSKALES